jgi:hypothetical protein
MKIAILGRQAWETYLKGIAPEFYYTAGEE